MNAPPTLDARRRRVLFRAWHRGTREMDLILGRFADAAVAAMSDDELDQFEALMEVSDPDLFGWIVRGEGTPADYDTAIFRRVKAFHTHDAPIRS